ncbi:pentapeptide repeat-containing protein [Streptomyces sp. NBC_00868]|uniref:pentapeptide repeat-containing protein n=1 Tax=unclassified Streptomyces TaxID=2593676 RepID=UPI00324D5D93|nr:pentapeptide repeat-containing protein [Streptomyces sp. NBC_00868]
MAKVLSRRRLRARRMRRLQRYGSWFLALLAALALMVGLPWLMWQGPYLIDAEYIDKATVGNGTGSAALVTGLRSALVACVAAIGAGIALVYTARNYRLSQRGQVTDRFTKALERLGSEQVYVRIGGVLALEQIVQDAPGQATHAAKVLGHFVRHRTPARSAAPQSDERATRVADLLEVLGHVARRRARARQAAAAEPNAADSTLPMEPNADVQAALTALTRPASRTHVDEREILALAGLHLTRANLGNADLTCADLRSTDLTDACLTKADLTHSDLRDAHLSHANLDGADLTRADLRFTRLIRASLDGAHLTDADLTGAHLTSADLSSADLTRARLTNARLTDADLGWADLTDADLRGVDLTNTRGMTVSQVQSACTDPLTKLPPDIGAVLRIRHC